MEEKGRAVVEIFGEEYTMKGNATPEYMTMLADYVDRKMKQVAARQPQLTVTKIAVLAALNVADELSKLQENYDALIKMADNAKKDEKREFRKEDRKEDKRTEKKQA